MQKCNCYRFAAATRFTISATAFHFFRMTGRFANLAGIFPLCFTHGTFSEMARMDTYIRFVPPASRAAYQSAERDLRWRLLAHPTPRRTIRASTLRQLCFSHIHTSDKGNSQHAVALLRISLGPRSTAHVTTTITPHSDTMT